MTDTANPNRVEPTLAPPSPTASALNAEQLRAVVEAATAAPAPAAMQPVPQTVAAPEASLDQLSRIEEKASRLEEKLARSEAHTLRLGDRVEASTSRISEAARQADLAALRNEVRELSTRVRRLPGLFALLLTALVTAALTALMLLAAQKYGIPGFLPPR